MSLRGCGVSPMTTDVFLAITAGVQIGFAIGGLFGLWVGIGIGQRRTALRIGRAMAAGKHTGGVK